MYTRFSVAAVERGTINNQHPVTANTNVHICAVFLDSLACENVMSYITFKLGSSSSSPALLNPLIAVKRIPNLPSVIDEPENVFDHIY